MITASVMDDVSEMYIPRNQFDEYEGEAWVYKLSEPKDLDGDGVPDEYVVVRLLWRRYASKGQSDMHAEIAIFPCNENGAARGDSLMRRMGSFPLVPDPKGNPDAIAFAIGVAFKFYDIEVSTDGD